MCVCLDHFLQLWSERGFIVYIYTDLTHAQTVHVIEHFASRVDHSPYSCFALCVSSHGYAGHVVTSDSRALSIKDDIVIPFHLCASLAGKPKLLFVQACQNSAEGSSLNFANVFTEKRSCHLD